MLSFNVNIGIINQIKKPKKFIFLDEHLLKQRIIRESIRAKTNMRENETFPGGNTPENIANQNIESTYLGVIVIIHTLIILLAILGNSIVIYLVVTNFKLRNVRNAFMLNLTLSNLLLATVCTPWFLITLVNPDLAVSEIGCKLFNSIPIVIILVSAFSIMMISIDRWMFVVFARY